MGEVDDRASGRLEIHLAAVLRFAVTHKALGIEMRSFAPSVLEEAQ